jgi:hypothetical protein
MSKTAVIETLLRLKREIKVVIPAKDMEAA